jgi:hypothetical protein
MKSSLKYTLAWILCVGAVHAKTELPAITSIFPGVGLDADKAKEFIEGKLPQVAIELQQGTNLPVHYFLKNKFLLLNYNPQLTISVQKNCYLRRFKHKIYLSEDLENWVSAKKFFSDDHLSYNVQIPKDNPGLFVEITFPNPTEISDE